MTDNRNDIFFQVGVSGILLIQRLALRVEQVIFNESNH